MFGYFAGMNGNSGNSFVTDSSFSSVFGNQEPAGKIELKLFLYSAHHRPLVLIRLHGLVYEGTYFILSTLTCNKPTHVDFFN